MYRPPGSRIEFGRYLHRSDADQSARVPGRYLPRQNNDMGWAEQAYTGQYQCSTRTAQISLQSTPDSLLLLQSPSPHCSHPMFSSDIDLVILDFDSVLTDNRVYVMEDGREAVACHRGDRWGIGILEQVGIDVMILSTKRNPVVSARAENSVSSVDRTA